MKRWLLVVPGLLFLGAASSWGMLFKANLETPDYTAGLPLDGQDGWVGLASVDAAEVVAGHAIARSGRRAIRCWAGDLEVSGGYYDGAWDRPIQFDALTIPAEVRVEADVRLDGPDTGSGPQDDLASANLYARNGRHRGAWFYLSSTGAAFANSYTENEEHWYQLETPIQVGAYNHLAITLDYLTHLATFEVNHVKVGQLPFGGSGEQFQGVLLELATVIEYPNFDPLAYTGYWDNISVRAKPAR